MNVRALAVSGLADASRGARAIAIGAGLIALGWLFRDEVIAAVGVWRDSTAYNHCFLVIPIVLYLIWDRRASLHGMPASHYPLAALAGVPLALAWLIAERLGIMEGRQLVAMSFVQVLFFAMLGPRLWWRLAGPLLYLYFLVPFGAFLTPKLQDVTTVFVAHGLPLLHIPAYITGYTIEIPEGTFLIAEACAGLRFLVAAIAFGCLYALLMYRTALRRAVFIGVSIVVPVVANGFRALDIVALGHYLGSAEAVEADHVIYGWIFFSIVILILIVLGLPFREDQTPHVASSAPAVPVGHPLRPALIGVAALIVLAGIGPAVAARLDRAAAPDMRIAPPSLSPEANCTSQSLLPSAGIDAPGRLFAQRFDCGDGPVTLILEVFSPRSTASRLVAEQRRLVPGLVGEDVETLALAVPNAPPDAWRKIVSAKPVQVAAMSLWIDGVPAQLGMAARARQAWRSVTGGASSPLLLVVTADADLLLPDAAARRQAAARVVGFLQTQPAVGELIAKFARVTE